MLRSIPACLLLPFLRNATGCFFLSCLITIAAFPPSQTVISADTLKPNPYLKTELDYANSHITKVKDIKKQDFEPLKVVDRTTIDGKVITGYQAWFNATGDGSQTNAWRHWSSNRAPGLNIGNEINQRNSRLNSGYWLGFNMYPSMEEYDQTKLYKTDFPNLGNGNPAMLFSSYNYETIDLHFKWMQEYGIEVVAVQRFLTGTKRPETLESRNKGLEHIIKASEKYGRAFFIAYDPAGYRDQDFVENLKRDFDTLRDIMWNTPSYLRHEGKPVFQVVEFGNQTAFQLQSVQVGLDTVNWLKEQDVFLVLGTPSYWRTDDTNPDGVSGTRDALRGFRAAGVYDTADMLIPWSTGRFNNQAGAVNYYRRNVVADDLIYCKEKKLRYAPVLQMGFDFSLWINKPEKRFNEIPRLAGEFFNTQAKEALALNIKSAFVGMFDECDEATNLTKSASDSSEVPLYSKFVTYSSDGIFVSNDYYLRLTGKFQQVLREGGTADDWQKAFDGVKKSIGPVLWRSGFEEGMDPIPDQPLPNTDDYALDTFFVRLYDPNPANKTYTGPTPLDQPNETHTNGGSLKLEYKGINTISNTTVLIKNVDFNIDANTKMQYFKYSESADAADVFVDLIASDGTRLSQYSAITFTGKPITNSPLVPGRWGEVCANVGKFMGKKNITQIVFVIPNATKGSPYTVYFDDITITNGELRLVPEETI